MAKEQRETHNAEREERRKTAAAIKTGISISSTTIRSPPTSPHNGLVDLFKILI
jgi:hypothetical protein